MNDTKSILNLKFSRRNVFLSLAILMLAALLLLSPFLSVARGADGPYTIHYIFNNMIGTNDSSNPLEYYTSATDIPIANAYDSRFEFLGWYVLYFDTGLQILTPQLNYAIPAGTVDDIQLEAIFNTQPLSYPINYNLDGGINSVLNRGEYFGASDSEHFPIVFAAPFKPGYDFLGWTVQFSDGTPDVIVATTSFAIVDGTTGAVTLTAHWSGPITYTIMYEFKGGALSSPPSSYDITMSPLAVGAPYRLGYDFAGWTAVCDNSSRIDLPGLAIPAGTYGNLVLRATWTPINGAPYTVLHVDELSGAVLYTENLVDTIGVTVYASDMVIAGYTFNAGAVGNVLSGAVLSDGSLVLIVCYTHDSGVGYTVNHVDELSGVVLYIENLTDTTGVTVIAVNRTIAGYTFNASAVGNVLSGAVLGDGSLVLTVCYTPHSDTDYTVNHVDELTGKVLVTENLNATTGVTVYASDMVIAGYSFNSSAVDNVMFGIVLGDGSLVLTVCYTPHSDIEYTVHYYVQGSVTKVADSKNVTGQVMGASVTEAAVPVSGYTAVAPTSLTAFLNATGNVFTFYYTQNPSSDDNNNGNGGGSSKPKPSASAKPAPSDPALRDNDDDEPIVTPTPPPPEDPEYTWAALNIVLSAFGLALALVVMVFVVLQRTRQKKEQRVGLGAEERVVNRRIDLLLVLSLVVGVVSVILFLLTEDMNNTMGWVDQWTIVNAILFTIVAIAVVFVLKIKKTHTPQ
jgi:uncharacterized repeat protein (TIGR02543 family)